MAHVEAKIQISNTTYLTTPLGSMLSLHSSLLLEWSNRERQGASSNAARQSFGSLG
jgi:hypothetical protein